jgi:hypothetical protein
VIDTDNRFTPPTKNSTIMVFIWTDSEYTGGTDTQMCVCGYVLYYCGAPITWKSKVKHINLLMKKIIQPQKSLRKLFLQLSSYVEIWEPFIWMILSLSLRGLATLILTVILFAYVKFICRPNSKNKVAIFAKSPTEEVSDTSCQTTKSFSQYNKTVHFDSRADEDLIFEN